MKFFILIFFISTFYTEVFGQTVDPFSILNFPKTMQYSADTIKDIYVCVETHKDTEYTCDTIIHLDKSMYQKFIKDFNNNEICDPQGKYRDFHIRKLRHKYYILEFISTTNNKSFYYFKHNIMGLSVYWRGVNDAKPIIHSELGQIGLYYKMNTRNLLKKYNLTID